LVPAAVVCVAAPVIGEAKRPAVVREEAGLEARPIEFIKKYHSLVRVEQSVGQPVRTAARRPESTSVLSRKASRAVSLPSFRASSKGVSRAVVPTGDRADVLAFALSQVGKPYRRGGTGNGGWDCSGLVSASYRRAGVSLPHSSGAIGGEGRAVPAGQWRPGDVIHSPGHVALYLGNGLMVEAANPRAGVRVTKVRPGTARRF
jgi:cell wall-associated NlpC family hydrolase